MNVSNLEERVKTEQRIISDLQAELKSPNTVKSRKESIRSQIAQHREQLASARESLKRAKAEARKK